MIAPIAVSFFISFPPHDFLSEMTADTAVRIAQPHYTGNAPVLKMHDFDHTLHILDKYDLIVWL